MAIKGNIARRRICYHEAGHAVLGVLFWRKIEFAQIDDYFADTPYLGFVRFLDRDEARYLRGNEISILIEMAGTAAEFSYLEIRTGEDLSNLTLEHLQDSGAGEAVSDYDRICEAIDSELELLGLNDSADFRFRENYEIYLMSVCKHILRKPPVKAALKLVAEKLFHSGKASGSEIYDLCYSVEGFETVADKLRIYYFGSLEFVVKFAAL